MIRWHYLQKTNLWKAHADATKPFELTKHSSVITSGIRGEEEARSAAVGACWVLKALSASSLMPVLCKSGWLCLFRVTVASGPGASPRRTPIGGRWEVIQPERMPVSTRITAPQPHTPPPPPPRTRLLSDLLAHLHVAPRETVSSRYIHTHTRHPP